MQKRVASEIEAGRGGFKGKEAGGCMPAQNPSQKAEGPKAFSMPIPFPLRR